MIEDWPAVAKDIRIFLTSGPHRGSSLAPLIGSRDHTKTVEIDRSNLSITQSGSCYHLQQIEFGKEKIIAYRADGLSDIDFRALMKTWMATNYEKLLNEL